MDKKRAEAVSEIMAAKEALAIICYTKHQTKHRISCARLSEILKIPVNRIKETCASLEGLGVVKTEKMGVDTEVTLVEHENDEIKKVIDEAIWENRQEYGKIYKKIMTAELLDFMGDR
ncbi:MAG TPA: hypothetical protein ENN43_08430 [bacterium]|nr:hypothetical protein [bacterium]